MGIAERSQICSEFGYRIIPVPEGCTEVLYVHGVRFSFYGYTCPKRGKPRCKVQTSEEHPKVFAILNDGPWKRKIYGFNDDGVTDIPVNPHSLEVCVRLIVRKPNKPNEELRYLAINRSGTRTRVRRGRHTQSSGRWPRV